MRDAALAGFRTLCHHFSAIVLLPLAVLSTVRGLGFARAPKGKQQPCLVAHQARAQDSLLSCCLHALAMH